ncbi:sensor histidine kinase [Terricaulis silvestris]|uniref:histidine kinase n=1 Tax=Terricaulis silvestris TaxID=2686094 RepID=A0A6I6MSM2_9CAUL|nr:ATP-binding protein [Terricaulis silvestris]QGZ95574.1 Signal-transduction histidine kinase senX3 [Terricaulis silvestris]
MRPRLDALLRTTTFRLALVQAGVVLAFVVAMLVYVYFATVGQLIRDSNVLADQEYATLERAYAEGGMRRLNQEVVERAARQGPFLYVLAESNGVVVTGDFQQLPAAPRETPERVDFSFERVDENGEPVRGRASGRVGRLINGPILLVARDLGDSAIIAGRITQVLWTVAIVGLIVSIVSGLLAATQAARRAEALSNTAREVMAGDMTRRAPVRGVGDEFDELAEAMNAMLDRLERLMNTTRTAGDAIAHDLRSPLTRFKQKIENALDAPPDTDADREALRKAVDEADRLLNMFSAVLKLARVETASNWRLQRVDASEILRELAEFYEPAAEEQGLTLRAQVQDGLVVRGEHGLFTQAVSNLIENALKYTPSGGNVEVRALRRPDGRIEIDVLDDGPGVPPAERDRVLERFVRLETARSTPGVGLGLSLVAAVARLHQGGLHLRDGLSNGDKTGLGAALVLPAAA